MKEIKGKKSRDIYIYDEEKLTLTDKSGNTIKLQESLEGISDSILSNQVDWFFHKMYKEINEFKTLCQSLKQNNIEWCSLK